VDNLPSPNTRRWVASRKAAVVAAVRDGMVTMASALHRYQITEEEFLSWQRAFESYGLPGLRATFIQQYREAAPAARPDSGPHTTQTRSGAPKPRGRGQGTSKLDSNDQGKHRLSPLNPFRFTPMKQVAKNDMRCSHFVRCSNSGRPKVIGISRRYSRRWDLRNNSSWPRLRYCSRRPRIIVCCCRLRARPYQLRGAKIDSHNPMAEVHFARRILGLIE
jgi:hypothetical protein